MSWNPCPHSNGMNWHGSFPANIKLKVGRSVEKAYQRKNDALELAGMVSFQYFLQLLKGDVPATDDQGDIFTLYI